MTILNKLGQHETLKALIGLVLISIIAFGMFGFMADLYKALVQRKDPTIRSFDGLAEEINSQLADRRIFTDSTYALSLGEGYRVVGFDHDFQPRWLLPDNPLENHEILSPGLNYKPSRCLNSACICLYKGEEFGGEKDRDKNIVDCYTFGENTFISSPLYDGIYKLNHGDIKLNFGADIMQNYPTKYAIPYFIGKKYYYHTDMQVSPPWNVQTLYVEKIESDDKNYIYMAVLDPDTSGELDRRKRQLNYFFNTDKAKMLEEIKLMSDAIKEGDSGNQIMIDLFMACKKYYNATITIPVECDVAPECWWNPYSCTALRYPCVYGPKGGSPMVCTEDYFTYYYPDGCKPNDPVLLQGCTAPLVLTTYKPWQ